MSLTARLAVAALLFAPQAVSACSPAPAKPKAIDLVVCLDVSGSMNGLIDSAKIRLWDVVNELATVKPTPNLRVALYSYGNPAYGQASGYVRKEIDLTTDLDEVYAKLNALRINGGDEYVARVTQTGLKEQKWSAEAGALKLIFVCGNEAVDQDKQASLGEVAELARKQGVIVNTIHCGPDDAGWRGFAVQCGGSYTVIDQDRAKRDLAAAIKTPYDAELVKLGQKLNTTYLAFGKDGLRGAANQVAQDRAAGAAAPGAGLARAVTKANALYKCEWDLLDCLKQDPKLDVTKMKPEELPEEMRKLKPEERVAYLKKKADERTGIQKEINELSARRAKFVEAERKKQPKTDGEKALDEALKGIIREQAKAKGFEVPAGKK
ncbi:MAG TPA: vWA domain-containing protein [Fimbriiglobus sp.]|nr:vWA domain-containing protein [Fimbriiglobus sp.]